MHHITPERIEHTQIARELKASGKTYRETAAHLGKPIWCVVQLLKIGRKEGGK